MKNVVVIGAGAAGMMAAYTAAKEGAKVILLEKNEKTGKKIYITGKGRCNVTNDCDIEDFFKNIVSNSKFMYSSLYSFDNQAIKDLLQKNHCYLKVERGQRVFPDSDRSSDVISAFNHLLKDNGVDVRLNTTVTGISKGKVYTNHGSVEAESIIIATGGASYQSTGSTGDGYKFAQDLGHSIIDIKPSLVPLTTLERDPMEMQGLSLKNVTLTLMIGGKKIYKELGEMLFAHFGISGPLVLTASSFYSKAKTKDDAKAIIDMKPAMSEEELDKRILKDFEESKNKDFRNALDKLLPQKMIPVIVRRSGIDEYKKVHDVTREERQRLAHEIKHFELTVTGTREINEAIITQGGVNVKEIDPSTMESKIVPDLYFAGEVIDVDALTGGFNLQIAWSTGYLAGYSAATK